MLVFIGKFSLSTLSWVPICQGLTQFSGYLHHFVLAKLATSSIGVKLLCIPCLPADDYCCWLGAMLAGRQAVRAYCVGTDLQSVRWDSHQNAHHAFLNHYKATILNSVCNHFSALWIESAGEQWIRCYLLLCIIMGCVLDKIPQL